MPRKKSNVAEPSTGDEGLRRAEREHEKTGSDEAAKRLETERVRRGGARFWILVDMLEESDHAGEPGHPASVRVYSDERGMRGAYHDTKVWAQPVSLVQSVFTTLAKARKDRDWSEAWVLDTLTGELVSLEGATRAYVSLAPGVTPLRQGIWTPWASVLCLECHNESQKTRERGRQIPPVSLLGPGPDEAITTCQKCGSAIAVNKEITLLRDIVAEVGKRFAGDKRVKQTAMEQTGGMNAAASVELTDGRMVVFFKDEDAPSDETDALWASLYAPGAWEEGDAAEDGSAVKGADAAAKFVEGVLGKKA